MVAAGLAEQGTRLSEDDVFKGRALSLKPEKKREYTVAAPANIPVPEGTEVPQKVENPQESEAPQPPDPIPENKEDLM